MVEMILLVALVALGAVGAWTVFGAAVEQKVDCAADSIAGAGGPCGGMDAVASRDPFASSMAALTGADGEAGAAQGALTADAPSHDALSDPDLDDFGYAFGYDTSETNGDSTSYYVTSPSGGRSLVAYSWGHDDSRYLSVYSPDTHASVAQRSIYGNGARAALDTSVTSSGKITTAVSTDASGKITSTETRVYEQCGDCFGAGDDGYREASWSITRGAPYATTQLETVTYDEEAGTRTRRTIYRDAGGHETMRVEVVETRINWKTDAVDNDGDGQIDEDDEYDLDTWRTADYFLWYPDGSGYHQTYRYQPNGDKVSLIDHGHDGYDAMGLSTTQRTDDSSTTSNYEINWSTGEFHVTRNHSVHPTPQEWHLENTTTITGHIDSSWVPIFGHDTAKVDSITVRDREGNVTVTHDEDALDDDAAFQDLMAGSKALGDVSRLPLIGQPIIRGVFDIAGTHANPVQDALSFINPFD